MAGVTANSAVNVSVHSIDTASMQLAVARQQVTELLAIGIKDRLLEYTKCNDSVTCVGMVETEAN